MIGLVDVKTKCGREQRSFEPPTADASFLHEIKFSRSMSRSVRCLVLQGKYWPYYLGNRQCPWCPSPPHAVTSGIESHLKDMVGTSPPPPPFRKWGWG